MDNKITITCGSSEIIPNFDQINSDPNFVFPPDSSFIPKQLFDSSGNIITVNSWLECANYVNGGWSSTFTLESNLPNYLFYILVGAVVIFISIDIYKFINKSNAKN